MNRVITFSLLMLLGLRIVPGSAQNYLRSPRLGITHISLAEEATNEARYQRALVLGAGWNRWPLYWDRVEPQPDQYDWVAYDRLVREDLAHGLRINTILLGRPPFSVDDNRIVGLQLPIFADGSDYPEAGKALNPDNLWANFVHSAVERYRPGGVLARAEGRPTDGGVRVWEIWNEPDAEFFWQNGIDEYARLLKVAYIVAKQVDPQSMIMFGGLLYATEDNWLARVLHIFEEDPLRDEFNWYMDQVAVHSYSYPRNSSRLVRLIRQTLKAYGLEKPIWLNESGVRVWDDYPGPIWAENDPALRWQRATADQQASYFIQSSAFAWSEGAEVVFFHQLFDDCGDQPAGTNFPYNNGEVCTSDKPCFGDAFGLYRNEASSICFSQSLAPGSPRPVARAYQLVASIFGSEPFTPTRTQRMDQNQVQLIAFERPRTSERVYVLWNRSFDRLVFDLPASSDHADVYSLNNYRKIEAVDGVYPLGLEPATPDNYPYLRPDDPSAIGGPPLIVIEDSPDLNRVPLFLQPPTLTPTLTPTVTLAPIETPTPWPS